MERIINIKGKIGRYDVPSFAYADNEPLILRLNIHENRVGRYIVVVTCGTQKKTVYLGKDMTVEVLPEFIQKGEFSPISVLLEFRNSQGDKIIIPNDPAKGGFFVEPLHIEKVGESATAIGWMTKIENEMSALLRRCIMLEDKLSTFEDEGVPLLVEDELEDEIKGE
jgi:hypothetical protein